MKWLLAIPPQLLQIFHSSYSYLHLLLQANLLDKLAEPPSWTYISEWVRLSFIIEISLNSFFFTQNCRPVAVTLREHAFFKPTICCVLQNCPSYLSCDANDELIRLYDYNHRHQRNSTNQQIYTHFVCFVYSVIAKYDLLNCVLLTISQLFLICYNLVEGSPLCVSNSRCLFLMPTFQLTFWIHFIIPGVAALSRYYIFVYSIFNLPAPFFPFILRLHHHLIYFMYAHFKLKRSSTVLLNWWLIFDHIASKIGYSLINKPISRMLCIWSFAS